MDRSSLGHINSSLPLIHALVQRGHNVFCFAPGFFRNKINNTGAIYKRSVFLEYLFKLINGGGDVNEQSYFDDLEKTGLMTENSMFLINGLLKECKECNPDFIIHDSCAVWGKIIVQLMSIPGISFVTLFALNSVIIQREPFVFLPLLFNAHTKSKAEISEMFEKSMSYSRYVKQRYGFDYDPLDNYVNQEPLNLICTSHLFQPYSELLDSTFRYIGYDLDYRFKIEPEYTLPTHGFKYSIYFSFGSIRSDTLDNGIRFYQQLMDYFRNYPAFFLINISSIDKGVFDYIPSNFILFNGAPQLSILSKVDLFITHGGMNSVNEAIQTNTPMIVIPQLWDQFIVSNQVNKHNLGYGFQDSKISMDELEYRIRKVVSDSSILDACHLMSGYYKETGGIERALDLISSYSYIS